MVEIGIEAGGHGVQGVTDTRAWSGAPCDQRLRPEPNPECHRRKHDAANQATPVTAIFSGCHLQRNLSHSASHLTRLAHAGFTTSSASSRAFRKSSLPVPR